MKLSQYFLTHNKNTLNREDVQNLRLSANLYYSNCPHFGTEFLESDDHFAEFQIDGLWYTIGFYYSADNTEMNDNGEKSRIRIPDMFINDSDDGCECVNVDSTDLIGELIDLINDFREWHKSSEQSQKWSV